MYAFIEAYHNYEIMNGVATLELKSGSPTTLGDTTLKVAGVDLASHTRGVVLHAHAGDLTTARLELLVSSGFDVTLPAVVTVEMRPLPGYDVIAEPQPDGSTRYRAIEVTDAEPAR